MSDHTYEFVQCNGCGVESRKEARGMMQQVDVPPEGWLAVVNRDGRKLWDLCPECSKAFTVWLLTRAGALPKEDRS